MRHVSLLASMNRKLRSSSGETMVETLVSVLISALALLLLSTAIGTSVNIVLSSKDHMEKHYTDESAMVVGGTQVSDSKEVTLDVPLEAPTPGSGSSPSVVSVSVFGSEDADLYLYRRP